MGRSPCCSENGLKKGPWTPEEDKILIDYMHKHGLGSWRALPKRAGLNRCGKSCRLRWTNYLRPDIKRGNFSQEEEHIIINLHSVLGNKWSRIAANLPGRTDNEIKNLWNTHLRKKLLQMGVDPKTHKPITHPNFLLNLCQLLSTSSLCHFMNPWDTTLGLQSDANQLAYMQLLENLLQVTNTSPIPNMEPNHLLESQNLSQFDGLIPHLDINPLFPSDNFNIPSLTSWFGGGFDSGILNFNLNSLSGKITYERENMLPELVSATPETSIVNKMESKEPSYIPTDTGGSNFLESNWEKMVDDEAISLLLKDIME